MLVSLQDFRLRARKTLPGFVFDYLDGGAEDEECLRRNREAYERLRLVPRVLQDTSSVATSIEVFGSTWRYPFAIGPTGLNGLIRPGGDGMLATAAAKMGVPFTLSTASNQRLEDVRTLAGDGEQWLQLYVMRERALAEQLVRRARRADYKALVLTVDVPVGGHRWRDTRNGFGIPLRITPRMAWDVIRRPGWAGRLMRSAPLRFINLQEDSGHPVSMERQASLLARTMDRTLVWESLKWLRELWDGPLLLKGVLHPGDAGLAIRHGIDGIVVSNHGGRQLDASPSAIGALPGVVAAVRERIPVFLDSGVRSAADVIRAQALGAKAVFLGRPTLYGLACDGEAGISAVLEMFAADYQRNLVLLGLDSARSVSGQVVCASGAAGLPV